METPERSPLVIIRAKEDELAERLNAARASATDAIVAARRAAAALHDQAEREGQEAAALAYRTELQTAELQAQRIVQAGEREATQVAARGLHTLPRAVERILEIVLPSRA